MSIELGKQATIERHGRWDADNFHLGDGVWTISPDAVAGTAVRMKAVLQLVADTLGRPLDGLRVADLGCAEGQFAIEFALQGASVLGIEGRRGHYERAKAAADLMGIDSVEFVHGDVRSFDRERYGSFDVVLCLGILYHLDWPWPARLVANIAGACERLAVVETHVSLVPRVKVSHAGRDYWGKHFREHDPASTPEQRMADPRASIDNPSSFWLTRPSLYNMLADEGFTTVLEARVPRPSPTANRIGLVAIKGAAPEVRSVPTGLEGDPGSVYQRHWAERELAVPGYVQMAPRRLGRRVKRLRRRIARLTR